MSYRERVCDALNKYHGIPEGTVRKPRRKPSGDRNAARRKAGEAYSDSGSDIKSRPKPKIKKSRSAPYKDPQADSKLEMIRNIRAQRAVTETKKTEVVERAKLLIAEAEKAAKALEVAATKSPLALASLMETRKLIAEATRSIQAAESGQISYVGNKNDSSSFDLNEDLLEDETGEKNGKLSSPDQKEVNGSHVYSDAISNFEFGNFDLEEILDSDELLEMESLDDDDDDEEDDFIPTQLEINGFSHKIDPKPELAVPGHNSDEAVKYRSTTQEVPVSNKAEKNCVRSNDTTVKKKWIRGRLVEVEE